MNKNTTGFTIVELLIVIVVIAILAAISIVAYNGIQQRANNTAIINAASSTVRLVKAYMATEGAYPITTSSTSVFCVTTEVGCNDGSTSYGANATFDSLIATVGQPPRSVPTSGTGRYGIQATYWSAAGIAAQGPFYITYWLEGVGQPCGVSSVLNAAVNGYSTTGFTNANVNSSGKTLCMIHVPGPAHS